MVSDTALTESRLAAIAAEELRRQGYAVEQEVPLDFLPGFRADLVARKGGETRVIAVKYHSTLTANPIMSELSRVINAKPGWSFELQLVGEPEKRDAPAGAKPLTAKGIHQRLADAEKARVAGFGPAAFLLAWSAAEAVLRELVAAEGVAIERITTAAYVLDYAVYQGVLSRADYDRLTGLMACRNALIHGFAVPDFDAEMAFAGLLEILGNLMDSAEWTALRSSLSGKPPLTLAQLLAGVTPDNLHQEMDTGPAVGGEAW